jgi:hypothetical protein
VGGGKAVIATKHAAYADVYAQPSADVTGFLVDDGGVVRPVSRTFKDLSASGDTELVPAQAGLKIRVCALAYRSALGVSVRFKSTGNNNISASYSLGINDDLVWPYNPQGWMETNAGEALVANQSVAVASGAQIVWIGVP